MRHSAYKRVTSAGATLYNRVAGPRRSGCVFGVGAAKTGTHTIGEMFADRVPSAHEKDAERLIRRLLEYGPGSDRLRRFLKWRDLWRGLQIDASQVNIYLIEDLRALFPESRFILTVRSPAPWLRSIIDDSLRRETSPNWWTSPTWHRFRDYRFGAKAEATGPEAVLGEHGVYTIDGYLAYWAFAITTVTRQVPPAQLMIVRTEDIGARAPEIATFAGVPDPDRLPERTHAFHNADRSGLLDRIPRAHLKERLEAIVGAVARETLPGWTASADLDLVLSAPTRAGAGAGL